MVEQMERVFEQAACWWWADPDIGTHPIIGSSPQNGSAAGQK